jgi:hypothetical protein
MAVTILNTLPGGYWPWIPRFVKGVPRVVPERDPVRLGNASNEKVRVVGRAVDIAEDTAVPRVHGDGRSGLVSEGVPGDLLQSAVQAEDHVRAGDRGLFPENADLPSPGIHFHLDAALGAPEIRFHLAFHAHLADPVAHPVMLATVFFQLPGIDFAHVADHVRQQVPEQVIPGRVDLDDHPGNPQAVRFQVGHGFPCGIFPQRVGAERRGLPKFLELLVQAFRRKGREFGQGLLQGGVVPDLFRDCGDVETGPVVGQVFVVHVHDLSPGSVLFQKPDPVVLRKVPVRLALPELDVEDTEDQHTEQRHGAETGDQEGFGIRSGGAVSQGCHRALFFLIWRNSIFSNPRLAESRRKRNGMSRRLLSSSPHHRKARAE